MPLSKAETTAELLKWKPLVTRLAWTFRARLAVSHGIDDVIAIGMVALWHAIEKYDAENASGASFPTYAKTCVRNAYLTECRDLCTSNRRVAYDSRQSLDAVFPDGTPVLQPCSELEDPESALVRNRRESTVKKAVSALPPHYRIVIQRRYERGAGFQEMAPQLGCSRQLLQQRELRAIQMMRPLLVRHGIGRGDE